MQRPLFIVTNILLPLLAVVAMIFVFWHWKGYPLPASLTSGKVGAMVAKLKRLKAEKIYMVRQKLHRRDCLEELRFFKLADNVFACENKETGTWHIHFLEDGTIRLGLPPGARRRYQPSRGNQVMVDLEEVFADPATFQRTTPTVVSVTSPFGPRHFKLIPDYSIADPALACHRLMLEEIGGDPIAPFRIELAKKPFDWDQFSAEQAPKMAQPAETGTPATPAADTEHVTTPDSDSTAAAPPPVAALVPTPEAPGSAPAAPLTPEPAAVSGSVPLLDPVPTVRPAPYAPLKPTQIPAVLPNEDPLR